MARSPASTTPAMWSPNRGWSTSRLRSRICERSLFPTRFSWRCAVPRAPSSACAATPPTNSASAAPVKGSVTPPTLEDPFGIDPRTGCSMQARSPRLGRPRDHRRAPVSEVPTWGRSRMRPQQPAIGRARATMAPTRRSGAIAGKHLKGHHPCGREKTRVGLDVARVAPLGGHMTSCSPPIGSCVKSAKRLVKPQGTAASPVKRASRPSRACHSKVIA